MIFALVILFWLALALFGLVGGAVLPPFLYARCRGMAVLLNVLGFFTYVVPGCIFVRAFHEDLLQSLLVAACLFMAVELLFFMIRGLWLSIAAFRHSS